MSVDSLKPSEHKMHCQGVGEGEGRGGKSKGWKWGQLEGSAIREKKRKENQGASKGEEDIKREEEKSKEDEQSNWAVGWDNHG